jgi:hypothetical protein
VGGVNPAESPDLWMKAGLHWHLDRLVTGGDGVAAHGWIAAPTETLPHLVFGVNGRPMSEWSVHPRPDVVPATPAMRRLRGFDVHGVSARDTATV